MVLLRRLLISYHFFFKNIAFIYRGSYLKNLPRMYCSNQSILFFNYYWCVMSSTSTYSEIQNLEFCSRLVYLPICMINGLADRHIKIYNQTHVVWLFINYFFYIASIWCPIGLRGGKPLPGFPPLRPSFSVFFGYLLFY